MTSVKHVIEMHLKESVYSCEFVRDVNGKWHAKVFLPNGSQWCFRQDQFGPFHPCDLHAERLAWVAIGMVNSGRVA